MTFFNRHRIAIFSIAACAIVAGAIAFFLLKPAPAAKKTESGPKPALTVTTAQPTRASVPVKLSANGSIAAWQEAIIGSEAAGLRLTEVRAQVGDCVSKGQVLALFALESVQAEVAQTRASLAEAEANSLDAAANANKARTLQASGALSEQQINQYLTQEKTARARLEAAQALLTVQQVRLQQTRLVAPDNGIISARSATVGAVVGAGTELFRMIRGGRLEWRAEVTSSEMGRIQPGTPVTLMAANGAVIAGKTRMIGPVVNPVTRTGLVYVDLPSASADNPFKSGMFARGEFELGASEALTLQQRALVVRDGFNYVFKLGEGNRVSQVKVQTGRLVGERVEIVSGLTPEARVVLDGAGFLNNGDLVRVNDQSAAKPASAPAAPAQAAIK